MLPIKGESYITQGYGLTSFALSPTGKRFYKNFPGGIHPGIDFGTKGKHLPVVATVSGKIVKASYDGGWGNHVELQGDDGWRRQYCHLDKIYCAVGNHVDVGTQLGTVGTTGSSTGVHLHYGNRIWRTLRWEYRDPSIDFADKPPAFKPLTKGELVKAVGESEIYVWNGEQLFHIPDMDTLMFLWGKKLWRDVDAAIISKLPKGATIPSMAVKFP